MGQPASLRETPVSPFGADDADGSQDEPDAVDDSMFSEEETAILNVLTKGPANVDMISEAANISPSTVISTMIGLEILHRVRKNPDGTYTKKR